MAGGPTALDTGEQALADQVTATKGVIDSAVTLINGIGARVAAAVAAALAQGATPAQLQALTDMQSQLKT